MEEGGDDGALGAALHLRLVHKVHLHVVVPPRHLHTKSHAHVSAPKSRARQETRRMQRRGCTRRGAEGKKGREGGRGAGPGAQRACASGTQ